MELALIPPLCKLNTTLGNSYQMLLPDQVKHDGYSNHYQSLAEWEGTHMIMDNGMFESGKPQDHDTLCMLAATFKVREIVVPDVRRDADASLKAADDFLNFAGDFLMSAQITPMFAVQGTSDLELYECINAYADLARSQGFEQFTIGMPRWLGEEFDPEMRLILSEYVRYHVTDAKVHFLGLNRRFPADVATAARNLRSVVKGVDTDAPYVWAYHQKKLGDNAGSVGQNERPKHYFSRLPNEFPTDLVQKNIRILREWTRG